MERIRTDPGHPDPAAVTRAASVIRQGGLMVFPTETFYGLGADPRNDAALERLVEAKGRPAGSPILLLVGGAGQAGLVADRLPPPFAILTARFWPGPLTLVVQAREELSTLLTCATGTIGLRESGSPFPRALALELGWPVTGTSANRSGHAAARTPEELEACLGIGFECVDLLIDGGPAPGGAPSTVVDLTGAQPRLIRAGAVAFEQVLETLRTSA